MTDTRVVVEYESGPRRGHSFILRSPEAAARVHPNARITKYVNGKPYEGPQTAPEVVASSDLNDLTVKQLKAMASDLGLDVPAKVRKDALVEMIATELEAAG